MSDRNVNITALMNATLPSFPGTNRLGGVEIKLAVTKKLNVFFVLPGTAPNPDELKAHAEMLAERKLPAQVVHELGKSLGHDLCDVVLFIEVAWVDTTNSQAPRVGQMQLNGEIRRYDYREFLKNAEAALPEEQRIVAPGRPLKVV